MGAYTTVTATRFNGRPLTPVAVVDGGAVTGATALPRVELRAPEGQTVP
jgi:ornithine decarboxylase